MAGLKEHSIFRRWALLVAVMVLTTIIQGCCISVKSKDMTVNCTSRGYDNLSCKLVQSSQPARLNNVSRSGGFTAYNCQQPTSGSNQPYTHNNTGRLANAAYPVPIALRIGNDNFPSSSSSALACLFESNQLQGISSQRGVKADPAPAIVYPHNQAAGQLLVFKKDCPVNSVDNIFFNFTPFTFNTKSAAILTIPQSCQAEGNSLFPGRHSGFYSKVLQGNIIQNATCICHLNPGLIKLLKTKA